MENSNKHYKQINAINSELRELHLKHDNQNVLLKQTEEELKDLKVHFRKVRAENEELLTKEASNKSANSDSDKKERTKLLHQENRELNIQLKRLEYEKNGLDKQLATSIGKEDEQSTVIENQTKLLASKDKSIETIKTIAYQYEAENRDLSKELEDLQSKAKELKESLTTKEDLLGGLENEAKRNSKHRSDMDSAKREVNRQRKHLLLLAESSNQIQSELHASLISQNIVLEQLKLEYEEHTETVRTEWDHDRNAKNSEITRLKQQLESLKLMQFEDKQQLLREQREIVKALQTQFREYRQTAEFLFETEATKLEEKLRLLTDKYEEEIKYIVKVKDQHFDMMMTSKDAKIMNLIEGTDFQSLLVKHELELEQVRRAHMDELENMRIRTQSELRDEMGALQKEIEIQEMNEEKLKNTLENLENQVNDMHKMAGKRQEQEVEREGQHMKELQHYQTQLEFSHQAAEKLNQEKQDLRHRIVRLKFKANGDADETLPNLVKKLSIETSALKSNHAKLNTKLQHTIMQLKISQEHNYMLTQAVEELKLKAGFRENSFKEMKETLSRVLYNQVHGGPAKKKQVDEFQQIDGSMNLRAAVSTLQGVLDREFRGDWFDPPISELESVKSDAAEQVVTAVIPNVKTKIPEKLKRIMDGNNGEEIVDTVEVIELARGIKYLQKFEKLSSAFSTGTFKLPAHVVKKTFEKAAGLNQKLELDIRSNLQREDIWKGTSLYEEMDNEEIRLGAKNFQPRPPGIFGEGKIYQGNVEKPAEKVRNLEKKINVKSPTGKKEKLSFSVSNC